MITRICGQNESVSQRSAVRNLKLEIWNLEPWNNQKLNPSASSHRSLKAYKNIAGLFTLKGLNIAIGFVLVPLTLSYERLSDIPRCLSHSFNLLISCL